MTEPRHGRHCSVPSLGLHSIRRFASNFLESGQNGDGDGSRRHRRRRSEASCRPCVEHRRRRRGRVALVASPLRSEETPPARSLPQLLRGSLTQPHRVQCSGSEGGAAAKAPRAVAAAAAADTHAQGTAGRSAQVRSSEGVSAPAGYSGGGGRRWRSRQQQQHHHQGRRESRSASRPRRRRER